MTKKEIEMPVEIKLGQATYLVERKFVGIESREDILLKKLNSSQCRSESYLAKRTQVF